MEQITRDEMIGLLSVAACPAYCNNGVIVRDQLHGEIEQCQFCYEREHAITALKAAEPAQGEVVYRCAFCEHVYIEPVSRCDCLEHGVEQRWERWIITPEFCPPAKAQVPDQIKAVIDECDGLTRLQYISGAYVVKRLREAMLTASPAPERHDGWVIADNPPTANGEYLVHYSGAVFAAEYKCSANRWVFGSGMGAEELTGITHWMPKPPPPQQEEAER